MRYGPQWIVAGQSLAENAHTERVLIDSEIAAAPPLLAMFLGSLSVAAAASRVSLVAEDSGPGIPVEERPRLSDRFRRATEDGQGAGLGLAIADSIVRSTGGRWNVGEPTLLGGARLEVSWRRHQPRQARRQAAV